ncbi:transporter substrate-binding domain-containing protein [Planococcus shenhongbingii]|uniref:Transporter substrate-binding domain-containing protein n=1 Tax=Planococcus shenhongbingii TaxID=3058398 RepID=A0ABT8NEU1_9BACL|nr:MULTISPECIES: transporter substrate-binding domain-containing protein [unclassified Planococcus (in: firmicutes)]MDN7246416.1 transporter substrate-binding domain-containing protein [Planococcus sp. N017]WKA59408.1 transporter substrate-binding domain-containing protein [Planococcus sp. N016]
MKNTKSFLLLFVVAIVSLLLAACGSKESTSEATASTEGKEQNAWERIQESGKIVVGTEGLYYPITYHDETTKELTGYDVEVARALGEKLGLEVEFKEMEFDGLLPALRNGQIDIAANDFSVTDERKEKFDFTIPIKHSYGSAIVRESDNSGIESVEDLKGKKVGGSATSNYSKFAQEQGAEVIVYTGSDTVLPEIVNGRVDATLNDYLVLMRSLEQYGKPGLKLAEGVKFSFSSSAIVLPKDSPELKEKIDAALEELLADGTIKEISNKFLGADVTQPLEKE